MALPCAIPDTATDEVTIGYYDADDGKSLLHQVASFMNYDYLTTGETTELDFSKECKNYNKLRKIFRENIKVTHDYCSGIGEECEYSGSPGR